MTSPRAYLDYNASAPLLPAARAAMLSALDVTANPSSVHQDGRAARRIVESARRDVAVLTGAKAGHVVFTSGATEAAAMMLTPDWRMGRAPLRMSRLYVAASDHPCLLNGGRFAPDAVTKLTVDADGVLDIAALDTVLSHHDHDAGLPLVAIHAANNETGVIQPIEDISHVVKAHRGVLVVDAVQAAGRFPLDMTEGYGDFLILSSHKMGGPKGAGAIVGASDLMMPVPLVVGGGQEKGHRSGTENVPAIAGFGAAARDAADRHADATLVAQMRDELERSILEIAPDAVIHGRNAARLPNTTYFSVPGMKAETAQIAFDLAGISVSAGSACSSGKVGQSHVLKAMGVRDDVGALRVSLGAATTREELGRFAAALSAHVARLASSDKAA
jgi:cysteine desulfurase